MTDVVTFVLGSLVAAGILFAFWLVFKPHETSSTRAREKSLSNPVYHKWHTAAQEELGRKRQGSEIRRKEVLAPGMEPAILTVSESARAVVKRVSVPWTETLREMGLTDVLNGFSLNEVSGQYRNHNVTVGQPISENPERARSDFTIKDKATCREITIGYTVSEHNVVFHRKPLQLKSAERASADKCVEAEMKLFYHADAKYRFIGYVHLD